MRERERERDMNKKFLAGLGFSLVVSTMTNIAPANADYPAISGLSILAGSADTPIWIDSTPKSIPANSKVATLSTNQKTITAYAGKPTVCKFTNLPKSSFAEATIKSANGKISTYLGAVTTDQYGKLQLPAFGLYKSGKYTLTVKVGKSTRVITVTIK